MVALLIICDPINEIAENKNICLYSSVYFKVLFTGGDLPEKLLSQCNF